jgi:hypothetical protein
VPICRSGRNAEEIIMEAPMGGLVQLVEPLVRGIGWVVGKAWGVYARILNLPILVGAVLDGAAGVYFGVGMLGSGDAGTGLLGLLLTAGGGLFAGASVVTWVVKVRDEREDAEHRLRYPKPLAIAGREPRRLDPHHPTPS